MPLVIEGRVKDLGDGFKVRRILPYREKRCVGPFVFFDHMGPVTFKAGQGIDVRPHPHIGLSTVTYLFDGCLTHRDSLGVVQDIRPGDVNWMTAGKGIVHSERTEDKLRSSGGITHGMQFWVALPKEQEEIEPAFYHHPAKSLPQFENEAVNYVLIAGEFMGQRSPVKTYSPMFYMEARAKAGTKWKLPRLASEIALYPGQGSFKLGGIDQKIEMGSLAVFDDGPELEIEAVEDLRMMIFGGEPFPEERHIWWNLVSHNPERIEKAKADWKEGRFDKVPNETEFIPLPD